MTIYSVLIVGKNNLSKWPSEDSSYHSNLHVGETITWHGGGDTAAIQIDDNNNRFNEIHGSQQTLVDPLTWKNPHNDTDENYNTGQALSPSYIINFQDGMGNVYKLVSVQFGSNMSAPSGPPHAVTWFGSVPPDNTTLTVTSESNPVGSGAPIYSELVTCFHAATLMDTPEGPQAAATLKAGRFLSDLQGDTHEILWVSRRDVTASDLKTKPKLKPVYIPTGALGAGRPNQPLILSQNHGVLIDSPIATRMCGRNNPLISVKFLVGCNGIRLMEDSQEFAYVHFLVRHHVPISSHGVESESLLMSAQFLTTQDAQSCEYLRNSFPEIWARQGKSDLLRLTRKQCENLILRSVKNAKPLISNRSLIRLKRAA